MNFKLWLEFEEINATNWNIENDFCNIPIFLDDGRKYGLNIWSYKYLETSILEDLKKWTKSQRIISNTTRFIC